MARSTVFARVSLHLNLLHILWALPFKIRSSNGGDTSKIGSGNDPKTTISKPSKCLAALKVIFLVTLPLINLVLVFIATSLEAGKLDLNVRYSRFLIVASYAEG